MRRNALKLSAILMVAAATLSASVNAQKKDGSARKAEAANLPERIWQDPGDIASLHRTIRPRRQASRMSDGHNRNQRADVTLSTPFLRPCLIR